MVAGPKVPVLESVFVTDTPEQVPVVFTVMPQPISVGVLKVGLVAT